MLGFMKDGEDVLAVIFNPYITVSISLRCGKAFSRRDFSRAAGL
jgi:hypothetical protein